MLDRGYQNKGNKLSIGLLVLIVISWALYPWAISWVYPMLVRTVFAVGFVFIVVWLCLDKGKSKDKNLESWEKLLFAVWTSYFLCSAISTFVFNEGDFDIFLRYFLKSGFFLILFFYLNKKTLFLSLDYYANLSVVLVLLSMASIIAFYLGWLHIPLVSVTQGANPGEIGLVFSGFDGNARVFPETSKFMRMQSFAIEPGAFSLAILPAMYWLVLVRKQFVRASVISLGVAASWSLGGLLAMLLAILFLYQNKCMPRFTKSFFLFSAAFFLFSHAVISNMDTPNPSSILSQIAGDRSHSLNQRWNELIQVKDYVSENYWGAGIGEGRYVLKSSISVGYANVFADTGILGGGLYLVVFLLIGYEAAKGALGKFPSLADGQVSNAISALSLAILTCLFFGLQREQPDASYWHMWIYASFFTLVGIARQGEKEKEQC